MFVSIILLALSIKTYGASGFVSSNCFGNAKVEEVSSFRLHDENEKSSDFLYFGVVIENSPSAPIIYVKARPTTPIGRILEIAASTQTRFRACFSKSVATMLRKELENQKTVGNDSPRYEHQKAVELVGAELYLANK